MSPDLRLGDVIVGNNLVYQGSLICEKDVFSIERLFDLCQLAESLVLHERLVTHKITVPEEFNTDFAVHLLNEDIFTSEDLVQSRETKLINLSREFLRFNLGDYLRVSDDSHEEEPPGPFDIFREYIDRERREHSIEEFPRENFLDDKYSFKDSLMDYSSKHSTYFNRTILFYLIALETHLPYTPHFQRIPIVQSIQQEIEKTFTKNLAREIYSKMAEALRDVQKELAESGDPSNFFVPPIMAEILRKTDNPQDIPDLILDLRDRSQNLRGAMQEYQKMMNDPDIPWQEKRREIHKWKTHSKELVMEIMKVKPSITFTNLIPDVVGAGVEIGTGEFSLNVKKLVTIPLDRLLKWWRRRHICFLFNVADNILTKPGYSSLIKKVFGTSLSHKEILQFSKSYSFTR